MVSELKTHEVTSTAQFASSVGWELLIWDPTILATISEVADVVSRFFFWSRFTGDFTIVGSDEVGVQKKFHGF